MISTPYTRTIPVQRLPLPQELSGGGWILGTVSVSHRTRGVRYTLSSHTYAVDGVLATSRDIARWWVKTYYDPRRLRRRRLEHAQWTPIPLLAKRGVYNEAYYVDIRALHKEIISRVGYDVEYALLAYMSLNPIHVRVPKAVYVSLSSLAINPRLLLRVWDGAHVTTIETYNRYANTSLYALIRDVQHAIADDIVTHVPVVYYNTDGCIVTSAHDVDTVCDIVASWGLEARIKQEGRCVVSGVAAYTFGSGTISRRVERSEYQRAYTQSERDWLRARLRAAEALAARDTVDLSWLQPVSY